MENSYSELNIINRAKLAGPTGCFLSVSITIRSIMLDSMKQTAFLLLLDLIIGSNFIKSVGGLFRFHKLAFRNCSCQLQH